MSPKVVTEEPLQLDLDVPIKFETVQQAAEHLKSQAERAGLDQAIIADIETIGTCDAQSLSKVLRYAEVLHLDATKYTW